MERAFHPLIVGERGKWNSEKIKNPAMLSSTFFQSFFSLSLSIKVKVSKLHGQSPSTFYFFICSKGLSSFITSFITFLIKLNYPSIPNVIFCVVASALFFLKPPHTLMSKHNLWYQVGNGYEGRLGWTILWRMREIWTWQIVGLQRLSLIPWRVLRQGKSSTIISTTKVG